MHDRVLLISSHTLPNTSAARYPLCFGEYSEHHHRAIGLMYCHVASGTIYATWNERQTEEETGQTQYAVVSTKLEMDRNQSGMATKLRVNDKSMHMTSAVRGKNDPCYMQMEMCGSYENEDAVKLDMQMNIEMGNSQVSASMLDTHPRVVQI